MVLLSNLLTLLVSLIHIYIVLLETTLWTHPAYGRKIFRMTEEFAQQTRLLAVNQGVYNGFLALGLLWGIWHPVPMVGQQVKLFFLGCVSFAGGVGALTVGRRVFWVQSVPAMVAGTAVVAWG
ncbi:uncharacterized protein PODANS_5_1880 [Podospora anserina S mat+]|uniref:Podospora anserina S mat+ genomic DNA chromosome 5, supercontig 1 n=1 Tax=Podospora anserina (strain S / ATCC MYA-4624 / DSM 980 / FGSC 10383) TaxID=515849 RepID=B2AEP7_PODAN|nr:uncharacterized protein PODANS_5_1880 [Podospora anserina S mat+]CAP61913.1 unnamed protein product [Podospora anserina S mat+]CDP28988.1 Putative protein of unknown function [Podospora anserina S mat+]